MIWKRPFAALIPQQTSVLVPFGCDFCLPHEKFIKKVHETKGAKFALPSEFFKELEKKNSELPTVKGEMLSDYRNFKGYYSSRIRFKQLYRRAEKEVLARDADEEEWKNLLYATYHDLITGTGVDGIYTIAERKAEKYQANEGNCQKRRDV